MLCVGANVGVTAEFTSKIAASLVGQFQLGRLSCAVQSLAQKAGKKAAQNLIKRAPVKIRQEAPTTKASKLDFYVWVPLRVSQVSSSPGVRERMYILQRTCVAALWRSKVGERLLAGEESNEFMNLILSRSK